MADQAMAGSGEGVLDFVTRAAEGRAAHYREQATQLRQMAEAESIGRLRTRLLHLAEQYDSLAANAQLTPPSS